MANSDLLSELDPIFNAQTVAIIGASNTPGKWGYSLMERPLKSGFPGTVIPVNPRESEVQGHRAYASVLAIPGPVDLAVVTVPAQAAAPTLTCSGVWVVGDPPAFPARRSRRASAAH